MSKENPFQTRSIPVRPDTHFQFNIRFKGELKLEISEYDETGKLIGGQYCRPLYFERPTSVRYAVQTSPWTDRIVVTVSSPSSETSSVDQIELQQESTNLQQMGGES